MLYTPKQSRSVRRGIYLALPGDNTKLPHEQGTNPTMSIRECITDILKVIYSNYCKISPSNFVAPSVDEYWEHALLVVKPLDIVDLDDSEPDLCQWETSVARMIREICLHPFYSMGKRWLGPNLKVRCICIVREPEVTMAKIVQEPDLPLEAHCYQLVE